MLFLISSHLRTGSHIKHKDSWTWCLLSNLRSNSVSTVKTTTVCFLFLLIIWHVKSWDDCRVMFGRYSRFSLYISFILFAKCWILYCIILHHNFSVHYMLLHAYDLVLIFFSWFFYGFYWNLVSFTNTVDQTDYAVNLIFFNVA